MIGWVAHVLADFLEEVGGAGLRAHAVAAAGFEAGVRFRLDADYADAACRAMLDAALARAGLTEEAAFAAFAPYFLARSRDAFPGFFEASGGSVRAFLLHQPETHNVLAAGLREGDSRAAVARKFAVEPTPTGVRLRYRSPNRLAGLYVAVARRLGEEMGQPVSARFEEGGPGDERCVIAVDIAAVPASAALAEAAA